MPSNVDSEHRIAKWVDENTVCNNRLHWLKRFIEAEGTALRRLSYGNTVYEFEGLGVAVATCMTDTPNPDEIRSLILMPDGHLYHSWNHRGSILL